VNSYASLFFVAFIKQNIPGDSCTISCMDELAYNLTIIFGWSLSRFTLWLYSNRGHFVACGATVTRLVVSKTIQFLYLFVFKKMKEREEQKEIDEARAAGELLHGGPLSQAEQVRGGLIRAGIKLIVIVTGNGAGRIRHHHGHNSFLQ
jgi:hypothetical protein